jgi:hypothetical protein
MMIKLKRNGKVGSLHLVLIVLAVVLPIVACQYEVTISMSSDIPPSFKFEKGHVNYLDFFVVKEVAPENQNVPYTRQDPDKNVVIWQIWPKTSDDGRIDKLPAITYGKVPAGFVQKIPNDVAPATLVEGKVYEAGGPPITMSKGFLRFTIKDGKAMRIEVPGQE